MAGPSRKAGGRRLERNDRLVRLALLIVAFSAVSVLLVITVFVIGHGTPIMFKYGLKSFLAGTSWYPSEKLFGLWPMLVGSLLVTLGALVIGVPFGLRAGEPGKHVGCARPRASEHHAGSSGDARVALGP